MKPMYSDDDEVFGWLLLEDGTEIDLDGQTLAEAKKQINGRPIKTYKHPCLMDESDVVVGDSVLKSVGDVRTAFDGGAR